MHFRALIAASCLSTFGVTCLAFQPGPADTQTLLGREVKLGTGVKALLDRSAAAYHGLKSYQDTTETETLFVLMAASGATERMPSRHLTRFAYAGPRKYTLRAEDVGFYCHENTFTNQIRMGRDEKGNPTEEKEVVKLPPEGPVDWRDAMGSLDRLCEPNPGEAVLMTGPGSIFEIFLEAEKVEPGELDERPGTWVVGKGPCAYTFGGRGGGKDIVPIRAWFSAKSGLLREVRYDISNTSWAQCAAANFGNRHNSEAKVTAEVTVHINNVKVNEPIDDKWFIYSPDAPSQGRFEMEVIPAMGMAGMGSPAGTATPVGGIAPAMTPAKLIDAAPQPDSNEGEVISTAESLRSQLIDKPAPPFVTTTPDDKDIALNQFKGKVVLLDFWATWCGPCMQALPAIQRLSVDFKDRPVVVIGINRDKPGDVAKVRKTLERKEITFQQAMDLPGTIAKSYKVSAIPSLILIDNQGVVRAVHVGYEPGEEKVLADEINTLLKGEKIEAVR